MIENKKQHGVKMFFIYVFPQIVLELLAFLIKSLFFNTDVLKNEYIAPDTNYIFMSRISVMFSMFLLLNLLYLFIGIVRMVLYIVKPRYNEYNIVKYCRNFVCIILILIIVSTLLGEAYFRRDRINVYEQTELNFNVTEVHGKDIKYTKEFQDVVYKYYVSFVGAYNDLCIDGDYLEFFDKFINDNDVRTFYAYLKNLLDLYEGRTLSYEQCTVIESGFSYEKSQIPMHSLYEGNVYSLAARGKNIYKLWKDNTLPEDEKLNLCRDIVEKMCIKVNVFFDIVYGKELLNVEKNEYLSKDYEKRWKQTHNKDITVKKITITSAGNGKIDFVFENNRYACNFEKRRCYFNHNGENMMIQITNQAIVVNNCKYGVFLP